MSNVIKNIEGYEWCPETPPDLNSEYGQTGRLRSCGYCGSMHPADVAEAIKAGAQGHFADFKYGWPHKVYLDNIPNPHAGLDEIRTWSTSPSEGLVEKREPRYNPRTGERVEDDVGYVKVTKAGKLTHGKFYTVHLLDATPEDREIIERHLGVRFAFKDDGQLVMWEKM